MSTTVRVLNTSSENAVVIPYKAITEQLGEFFVYVVGDSNKVSQQKVVTGKQVGPDVIINSGLKAGQVIAVEGVQNLREGATISTGNPGAAAVKK